MSNDSFFAALTAYGGLAAALVAALALVFAYLQIRLVHRTLEADTFTKIQERASEIPLSETIDFINGLSFSDYDAYLKDKGISDRQRERVRAVADFFNDIAHLARDGYVNDLYPMQLYYPSVAVCQRKLSTWWLDGVRKHRGEPGGSHLYENLKRFCYYARFFEARGFFRGSGSRPVGYRSFLADHYDSFLAEIRQADMRDRSTAAVANSSFRK
jgi:hypothetical protein